MTVAYAAPSMPSAGAPNQPKMRIGSRTTFSPTEIAMIRIGVWVFP